MADGKVLAEGAILIFIMNVSRWRKIKEIFNEAAEMSIGERRNFLDEICDGDAEMRGEIEKMLVFADEENDSFEENAFEILTDRSQGKFPEHIGKYKIRREIGRGGMGAVYEAAFETTDFSQKVALKVIKRGMDTDQIVRRFRHEQKILASLVHPNIAQFLDGGMTRDNLPFYAMEFVSGRFIDDFCREENLALDERLRLFRQVCSAVQYAHQNLIIHRDLKPKNILVTAEGTPKLLDFGIGKILTPDDTEEIGTATQLGMMTPAYASPEQIQGKRIGTTSDIYSLGVILYELLTGRKPYKFSANSQLEIERAVCESEPIRPSSAVSRPLQIQQGKPIESNKQRTTANGQLTKLLKGDLDNIILKCLRKEPAARYASVQELSEDIRRHLEGLPIAARRHTLSYRAAKFVKRNRVAVAAAALIFLSLCVGITAAIWQAHRAEQQRVLAEKRFADVRQLANNVVFKYHDAIADLPGATAAREMLVGDALAYLDRLAAETTDDAGLQKELALAYLKMGDVQGKMYAANVGNSEGAFQSYLKSIALLEAVIKAAPDDTEAKDDLIQAYGNLAFLTLRTGGIEGKTLVEKAFDLYEQIPKTETNYQSRTLKLIDLYIRYGDTKSDKRNEALAERQKALSLIEELLKAGREDYDVLKASARVYQRIGTDYYWLGRKAEERNETEEAKKQFAQSLVFQEKSLAATERMFALAPEKPESQRYLAAAYGNSAESFAVNNRTDEALQWAGKFLAIVEKTLAEDPNNRETRLNLSNVNEVFANIYLRRGDDRQVIIYTQKALAIDEAIYQADKQNKEVLGRIKSRHQLLANIYAKRGEPEKAEFHRRKSEELSR